jgi:hypothetical protein
MDTACFHVGEVKMPLRRFKSWKQSIVTVWNRSEANGQKRVT